MPPNLTLVMTYDGPIDDAVEARIRKLEEDLGLVRAEETYDADRAVRRVVLIWPQEKAHAPSE